MAKIPSLKKCLKKMDSECLSKTEEKRTQDKLEVFKLKMLRVQQGVWHQQRRIIFVFEGFDASGKGGAIRRLTEKLDPRSFRVYPIGPPEQWERSKHYLYRFWEKIPAPGIIAIFDRSWYGRVLVERVEKLCPKPRWKAAYREINEFEKMLADDGVEIIKFFLAISSEEQLRRFEERLADPYKQWKLGEADVEARSKWDDYVDATEDMFEYTHTSCAPWHLVSANNKLSARLEVLETTIDRLKSSLDWMEKSAKDREVRSLKQELKRLEKRQTVR